MSEVRVTPENDDTARDVVQRERKQQKIVHLEQKDWVLQRPETYFGAMSSTTLSIAHVQEGRIHFAPLTVSPGCVQIFKEGFMNCLDNTERDATQKFITCSFDGAVLALANDGSTLPIARGADGRWQIDVAFSEFQAGSNFNTASGRKDAVFTAGRNGVGSKGMVIFSKRFEVEVVNQLDGMRALHTWERNMSVKKDPVIKPLTKELQRKNTNLTSVRWSVDYDALGCAAEARASMDVVCRWLAHTTALCAPRAVRVSFNGETIKLRTPEQFCKAMGGTAPYAHLEIRNGTGRTVCSICVAPMPDAAADDPRVHLFVNSTPCNEGPHAKQLFKIMADVVEHRARARKTARGLAVRVLPAWIAKHVVVVGTLLVEDPRFTGQDKGTLDTPIRDFGWTFALTPSFASALERGPLVDAAIDAARSREKGEVDKSCRATGTRRTSTIAKYERPRYLGRSTTTLIVTEGDSAKNFGVAGLSVGHLRDDYGLYPIRGKFLNVRGLGVAAIAGNKESNELLRILGLQFGVEYTEETALKLPYAHLMILSDQDVDGSHIAALLCNFIFVCVPSLLRVRPNYIMRFATPLIRATVRPTGVDTGFYSQIEFERFCAEASARGERVTNVVYFKGLGSSDASLAKQYFRDLKKHTVVLRSTGQGCEEVVDLFFNKKRAEARKKCITGCDRDAAVDYGKDEITVTQLLMNETVPQYAHASIYRAMPHVNDGLKEVQRKILFGARALKLNHPLSVAKAAGKISVYTNYHHRGTSLEDAIKIMAADYAGRSNVNLLLPKGQFGTRHSHVAASAAYPNVMLNHPLHERLFPLEDDPVLRYEVDEGGTVEPTSYICVIPLVLCMGVRGIAVGWSTELPMFHPRDVVDACMYLADETAGHEPRVFPTLRPYYRGFDGPIEDVSTDGVLRWKVSGRIHRNKRDIEVTEVPPFRETDAYREDWSKHFVVDVGVKHTDERVHLVLRDAPDTTTLESLRLVSVVSFANVHVLNAEGRLVRYTSPEEIVRDHATSRLRLYERRIAHQIEDKECRLRRATSKQRYIELRIAGTIDMATLADDDAAVAALHLHCLHADDKDGFQYLLNLPDRSFNRKRVEQLCDEIASMNEQLDALRSTTPLVAWRHDLHELRKAL